MISADRARLIGLCFCGIIVYLLFELFYAGLSDAAERVVVYRYSSETAAISWKILYKFAWLFCISLLAWFFKSKVPSRAWFISFAFAFILDIGLLQTRSMIFVAVTQSEIDAQISQATETFVDSLKNDSTFMEGVSRQDSNVRRH